MLRISTDERLDWEQRAEEFGFHFHTMYGDRYWDERAYYQFTLQQIEQDLEAPTEELHQMCLDVVDKVVNDEYWLRRFQLPEHAWDFIRHSWQQNEPSLYSRMDFAYSGRGPAKLYENNADTPTSIYETGFWQWLWLKDKVDQQVLPRHCDQFNSLQEKLVNRFKDLKTLTPDRVLHFACCKNTVEDRGTVQYLEDIAAEAGITTRFVYVEDIGIDQQGHLTDSDDFIITWLFKLYPWEFMFTEAFANTLGQHPVRFLEPAWKSVLSNKAILPMLWQLFPNHPNLLPAYFEEDLPQTSTSESWIKKPVFSREGANISVLHQGKETLLSEGPYGQEGFIYQQQHTLPKFGDNYTLIGSWLVDGEAAGISIREDSSPITQDMSRFLPHVIA